MSLESSKRTYQEDIFDVGAYYLVISRHRAKVRKFSSNKKSGEVSGAGTVVDSSREGIGAKGVEGAERLTMPQAIRNPSREY